VKNLKLIVIQANFLPLFIRLSLLSNIINNILLFNNYILLRDYYISLFTTISLVLLWIYNLLIESLIGYQTVNLKMRLMFAYLLFILSEVIFFFSFFWAYFDAALLPRLEIGLQWPPIGIIRLRIYDVPLLNTIILLRRGLSITWTHDALMHNHFNDAICSLLTTILYGWWFLVCQYHEYYEASFDIRSGIYGRVFFITTGFHGLHVFLGRIILLYCLIVMTNYYYLYDRHISFELSAWYWHFVDVVWLFLYTFIYSWGQ
jgi:cytochrome c oxidase subunit 3